MAERIEGTVVSSDGGLYEIYAGGESILCKPRGRFRHERTRLLVGDRVVVGQDAQGNRSVDEILARKNALLRPPLANISALVILCAAAKPRPLFLNIDKLTVIAEQNHIEPVIVVSKSDLDAEEAKNAAAIYEKAGFPVFVTSSVTHEGESALRAFLCGVCKTGIAALAGASGVGKSTLLNALFPALERQTGEISRIGRGRHTTRSVDLFPARALFGEGEGFIADTPGFSLLDFESFDFCTLEDLPYNFREFVPLLGTCRYTKCTHRREEGCAILARVRAGEIPPSRHESYRQLYDQLKDKRPWNS